MVCVLLYEEPQKSIHEIAKTLVGSKLPVKVKFSPLACFVISILFII